MPLIDLDVSGKDGQWADLKAKADEGKLIELMGEASPPIRMYLLRGGMVSGRHSVVIRMSLPDGIELITETSLHCLEMAMAAMRGTEMRWQEETFGR